MDPVVVQTHLLSVILVLASVHRRFPNVGMAGRMSTDAGRIHQNLLR